MVRPDQCRWSPRGAHLLLQVRADLVDGRLGETFAHWYSGFTSERQLSGYPIDPTKRIALFVRQWVEKKVRCHLARSSKRQGFGWKRWSRRWLYDKLGLFDAYRVSY